MPRVEPRVKPLANSGASFGLVAWWCKGGLEKCSSHSVFLCISMRISVMTAHRILDRLTPEQNALMSGFVALITAAACNLITAWASTAEPVSRFGSTMNRILWHTVTFEYIWVTWREIAWTEVPMSLSSTRLALAGVGGFFPLHSVTRTIAQLCRSGWIFSSHAKYYMYYRLKICCARICAIVCNTI